MYAPMPGGPGSPLPKPGKRRRKLYDGTGDEANTRRQTQPSGRLRIARQSTLNLPFQVSGAAHLSEHLHSDDRGQHDDNFDDDMDDEEFLKLTSDMMDIGDNASMLSSSLTTLSSSQTTQRVAGSSSAVSASSDGLKSGVDRTRKKFVSPVTRTTRLLAATGAIDCAEAREPIVRCPFPVAVRECSPIIGLSANTLLRTCFRIGEVINQAHQSDKLGQGVVFELYARIFESERDKTGQHFTFCDLFHIKPPYVKGTYEAALWKPVRLFDYDGKRLLQQGRMCRCMGTMKRDGRDWIMRVLNIWEATWEDIKWVEGVVNF
ncbi:hypothetical protein ACEQ8H_003466 [Pleosporales sp. CAS-2024a]